MVAKKALLGWPFIKFSNQDCTSTNSPKVNNQVSSERERLSGGIAMHYYSVSRERYLKD